MKPICLQTNTSHVYIWGDGGKAPPFPNLSPQEPTSFTTQSLGQTAPPACLDTVMTQRNIPAPVRESKPGSPAAEKHWRFSAKGETLDPAAGVGYVPLR
jgi:hypothetical protein